MVPTLNPEELHTLPLSEMFTEDCKATDQEMDENSSQGYCGVITRRVKHGSTEKIEDDLSQIVDEADQNLYPVPDLYSTAAKMEENSECSTPTERHACGSTPRASFSDTSATYGQNVELGNTSDSELDVFDEENSISFSDSLEQKDSSEGETDSQSSDFVFGSNYEPRPDPRWILGDKFRSQH